MIKIIMMIYLVMLIVMINCILFLFDYVLLGNILSIIGLLISIILILKIYNLNKGDKK
jgi:hypothetical protein